MKFPDDVDIMVLGDMTRMTDSLSHFGLQFKRVPFAPSCVIGRIRCITTSTRPYLWLLDDDDEIINPPTPFPIEDGVDAVEMLHGIPMNFSKLYSRNYLIKTGIPALLSAGDLGEDSRLFRGVSLVQRTSVRLKVNYRPSFRCHV